MKTETVKKPTKKNTIRTGKGSPIETMKYVRKNLRICKDVLKNATTHTHILSSSSARVTSVTLSDSTDSVTDRAFKLDYSENLFQLRSDFRSTFYSSPDRPLKEFFSRTNSWGLLPNRWIEKVILENGGDYPFETQFSYLVAMVLPNRIDSVNVPKSDRVIPMILSLSNPGKSLGNCAFYTVVLWDLFTVNSDVYPHVIGISLTEFLTKYIDKMLDCPARYLKSKTERDREISDLVDDVLTKIHIAPIMTLDNLSNVVNDLFHDVEKGHVFTAGNMIKISPDRNLQKSPITRPSTSSGDTKKDNPKE